MLDEVRDLPLPRQVKLLGVLQERGIARLGSHLLIPVNIRLIAATNQELARAAHDRPRCGVHPDLDAAAVAVGEYDAYLGLYNLAYMLDHSVMLTVAVVILSQHKLQENEGRWLKLISGVVMLGLAAILIAKSKWLAA